MALQLFEEYSGGWLEGQRTRRRRDQPIRKQSLDSYTEETSGLKGIYRPTHER